MTLLRTRLIPCLQVRAGSLVKTVKFGKFGYIGDPANTCRIFNECEVDELAVVDITATKDGRELSGIIVAETPTALTLRAPNKADETVLRGELKELTAAGLSLMPEGLEAAFTPQQLADLIAFVVGR